MKCYVEMKQDFVPEAELVGKSLSCSGRKAIDYKRENKV